MLRWNATLLTIVLSCAAFGRDLKENARSFPLDSSQGLVAVGGEVKAVTYRGQRANQLTPAPGRMEADGDMLAILTGSDFHDGTIEIKVAGAPRTGAPADARGFVGIGFRVQEKGSKGEYFYLRPTNARGDDQLRRNHSTQYVSAPDYPWERLRKESPGMYESYVDLEPGVWTQMKIVVAGTKAELYVNGAEQPALVVTDLKRGEWHGQIALWAHSTTEAYFSGLKVGDRPQRDRSLHREKTGRLSAALP